MRKNSTRRNFLKGTAAAVGGLSLLPLLSRRALAADGDGPRRIIFWHVPEGCAQQAFWPGSGPGALSINPAAQIGGGLTPASRPDSINAYRSAEMGTYCLQPLKAHEADVTVVSGFQIIASGEGPHKQNMGAALTGGRAGEGSLDQWLGPHLQGSAPFTSMLSTLYGEHVAIGIGGDFSCPFRTRSGNSASPTWNPVTTYNHIFPSGVIGRMGQGPDHRLRSRQQVMGAVRSRLNGVRCEGGASAQQRLESYLDSIERIEVETSALAEQDSSVSEIDVTVDIPPAWLSINPSAKYWHRPQNFPTLARIQIDTTVAAMALDRTRVSLMQFSASGNSRGIDGSHYKHIGIADLEAGDVNDHHLGHDNQGSRRRNQARIFRWYYQQLAYMIDRLKSIPEGPGTMFDNTLIVCSSEFGSYNHRAVDIPYLLVGNPCGAFRTGQYLDAHAGGKHRSHADLFLAIAQGMGLELNRFGTSTTPYSAILS